MGNSDPFCTKEHYPSGTNLGKQSCSCRRIILETKYRLLSSSWKTNYTDGRIILPVPVFTRDDLRDA